MLNIIKVIKFIILVVPGFTIFQDCIAQNRHIYVDVGTHNAALMSFVAMRVRNSPDSKASTYFKQKISYHAGFGLQSGKMDYGFVFKALTFSSVDRFYISSLQGQNICFKEEYGSGTFYSLAPRFGYTFLNQKKITLQGFVELGIPLNTRITPTKMVFSNDSVTFHNSVLVYAYDFRTGFVFSIKTYKNMNLTFSGYYLNMGHHNYDEIENSRLQLWGVGGGFLGGNVGVRYNIKMREGK